MRYFVHISYQGTNYHGWQNQPNAVTVQSTIENVFAQICRTPCPIVGCGRTDAFVHAKEYYFHFDWPDELPEKMMFRANCMLPADIAIHRIIPVAADAHARFDAVYRSYEYHLHFTKIPFKQNLSYQCNYGKKLELDRLQEAANLLLQYQSFYPFSKSKSDVKTMDCDLKKAKWRLNDDKDGLVFYIASNRFLRGMVRLTVGMCLNVAQGKLTLEEVKEALDKQERLGKSYSVPPEGLYLHEIWYKYI